LLHRFESRLINHDPNARAAGTGCRLQTERCESILVNRPDPPRPRTVHAWTVFGHRPRHKWDTSVATTLNRRRQRSLPSRVICSCHKDHTQTPITCGPCALIHPNATLCHSRKTTYPHPNRMICVITVMQFSKRSIMPSTLVLPLVMTWNSLPPALRAPPSRVH